MIKEARFLVSNQDVAKCPPADKPEYAFIGRSNVGKSSLVNMLCGNKGLAKTSSTPGKTQLINHFLIDGSWYLVDLPGYGYAKTSKAKREIFGKMTRKYLETRSNLLCLFVLIDLRIEPKAIDLEFMRWLGKVGIPFAIIFTKVDKIKKEQASRNVDHYTRLLLDEWERVPTVFITSAINGQGRLELLSFIDEINKARGR